jgi:PAS domain S-box-containing protein
MNLIFCFDVITVAVLLAALWLSAEIRSNTIGRNAKRFLRFFLLCYFIVMISNVLEHGGVTDVLDVYEDSLEVLLVPMFLFFMYSVNISREIRERKRAEEALRKERDYLETITRDMGAGLALISKDYRIIWTNKVFKDLFGDADGKECQMVHHMCEDSFPGCGAREVLESRKEKNVHEQVVADLDGRKFWSELITTPIRDEGGNVVAALELVVPITDRKRYQEALTESEARYHELFNSNPDAIFIVDAETKSVMHANPAALELYGYTLEEIVKVPFVQVSGRPQKTFKSLEDAVSGFSTRLKLSLDQRLHRKKNGQIFPVEVAYGSFVISGRRLIFAISRDITDRRQAEEALSAEKERLATTLRSIGDGVIATNAEGRITLMNHVAESLTGWYESEAIGKPLDEVFTIVGEADGQPCANPFKQIAETGKIVDLGNHALLISREGDRYIITDSGAPIFDTDHQMIGAVLVFRDVTERRRMENELVKVEKMESLGVLAGGIAHDFNNFLAGIIGNLSLARLELHPEHEVYPRLQEMEKAALRAKNLTHQLLTFSKGGEPVKRPIQLARLVKESASFALRGSNVRCEFDFESDLLTADVDEGQFSQVIHNLVINADQAMPEGGVVCIRAKAVELAEDNAVFSKHGKYVMLSIEDQGIGMKQEHLKKVFDPYFTTKQKGSGLGLTIAYSVIDKHGGFIDVDSELGKGTTFRIYLPAAQMAEPLPEAVNSLVVGGVGKLLVMDDEDFIRELALQMLQKMGYSVTLCARGEEAVELYRREFESESPFDAVILDLTVPGGMGGKETIRKLLDIDRNVRAIASSGYSNDPVMSDCTLYGFKAAVKKPYLIEDICEALRCVLSTPQGRETVL